jgi:hypothetical protein
MRNAAAGATSLAPILPLQLTLTNTIAAEGLLDTGATINVMPLSLGTQLGADWNRLTTAIRLAGNLASVPAKGLIVEAVIGPFPPVKLAFAWANTDAIPLLLGQVNFFAEFDVCFFTNRGEFEVLPKA